MEWWAYVAHCYMQAHCSESSRSATAISSGVVTYIAASLGIALYGVAGFLTVR
jgi:nicotinamide mononucleotide (NMN) deamidase PncC